VYANSFCGSLGLSCGIFKMAFLILIATRHETLWFSLTFLCLAMFCKFYTYPKHRKMFSWGKLIIINFSLLDIDNTKPSHWSDAVYDEFIFYFWLGCPLIFPRATSLLMLPKIGCPVNFLVVSDNRTITNFEHCFLWGLTRRLHQIINRLGNSWKVLDISVVIQ